MFFLFQSLSRVHAAIEVDRKDGEVNLYDNKSMNHTWKNDKKLKPQVRYNIAGGEKLKFGNVSAIFQIQKETCHDRSSNRRSTYLADTSK